MSIIKNIILVIVLLVFLGVSWVVSEAEAQTPQKLHNSQSHIGHRPAVGGWVNWQGEITGFIIQARPAGRILMQVKVNKDTFINAPDILVELNVVTVKGWTKGDKVEVYGRIDYIRLTGNIFAVYVAATTIKPITKYR